MTGIGKEAVDGAGHLGEVRAAVGTVGQFRRHEQEGLDPSPVEVEAVEQTPPADDLVFGNLRHDLDRAPGVE